jgi:dCMP deaminase
MPKKEDKLEGSVKDAMAQQAFKQHRLDTVYLNMAKEVATLSHCERNKVGAVLVKDDNVIGFGFNGTPKGMENECEEDGVTKDYVVHAEMNAILKAARHGYAVSGATLYLTLSPCKECSKLILQSGVKRVVYLQEYRNTEGLDLLKKFIFVHKYDNKQSI